jgi:hypothetical protein
VSEIGSYQLNDSYVNGSDEPWRFWRGSPQFFKKPISCRCRRMEDGLLSGMEAGMAISQNQQPPDGRCTSAGGP